MVAMCQQDHNILWSRSRDPLPVVVEAQKWGHTPCLFGRASVAIRQPPDDLRRAS